MSAVGVHTSLVGLSATMLAMYRLSISQQPKSFILESVGKGVFEMGAYPSQEAYDRAMTKKFCLKLNLVTDEDIIKRLEEVDKKQTYIKELIRADIRKA